MWTEEVFRGAVSRKGVSCKKPQSSKSNIYSCACVLACGWMRTVCGCNRPRQVMMQRAVCGDRPVIAPCLTSDQSLEQQGFVLLVVLQHPLKVLLFPLDGHLAAQFRSGPAGLSCIHLRDYRGRDTVRYRQIQSHTVTYSQIQTDTDRYRQIQSDTVRYSQIQTDTD